MKTYKNLWNQHLKKDVLFIIRIWNTKVGSQEIPGETGKLGLGVQNEAGQSLTVLSRELPLPTTQEMTETTWTTTDSK